MRYTSLSLVLIGVFCAPISVMAQTGSTGKSDTNMEILKEKLNADKKLLIAGNMNLSEAEAKQFWPLYNSYQTELARLNDRLGRLIATYAQGYDQGQGQITDKMAKELLDESLVLDEAEAKMRRTYADKLEKVLPATKTARYMQLESKIRALLRFELAQQIPLVY
ncbi:MAG TPA: hypothetical protein PKD12_22385 [Nitrospira sp.]|nr:hypothetical protein [Nitrospira sp.]